jgi:hypothetical protein
MTCSFHKFGEYFPGTGDVKDKGVGAGENCAINVPLHDGMDDESYKALFVPVISKIMERFQPGAVVLQCGADSLSGDRLGCFKLSIKGHGECVDFVRSFNLPTLVLGGGGYTLRNVPRCWAYETSVLLDTEISDQMPYNDYFDYYGPEYRLHLPISNMENRNSPRYLENMKQQVLQILDALQLPTQQIHTGQAGTTIIPDALISSEMFASSAVSGKSTLDSHAAEQALTSGSIRGAYGSSSGALPKVSILAAGRPVSAADTHTDDDGPYPAASGDFAMGPSTMPPAPPADGKSSVLSKEDLCSMKPLTCPLHTFSQVVPQRDVWM